MDRHQLSALLTANPERFVGHLLNDLGVPSQPLVQASGWSNQVWLAPRHVVRLSSGRFRDAFAHEKAVIDLLPPEVPHARVRSYGQIDGREWLIQDRITGEPLLNVWPSLNRVKRRSATHALGTALKELHDVPLPSGFSNPSLDEALEPNGNPRNAYHAHPRHFQRLISAAGETGEIDGAFLNEVAVFIKERLAFFNDDRLVLVHGDLHFSNLLWADGLVAILDFEGSRPAPADLELDTLLRQAREPALYCPPNARTDLQGHDFADFRDDLVEVYGELFNHPNLKERLEAYDAMWHLVQLLHFPPGAEGPDPYGHLQTLLSSVDHS